MTRDELMPLQTAYLEAERICDKHFEERPRTPTPEELLDYDIEHRKLIAIFVKAKVAYEMGMSDFLKTQEAA